MQTFRESQPVNRRGNGYDEVPIPELSDINQTQLEQIAEMLYRRYYFHDGMPSWRDVTAVKIRKQVMRRVSEVIECTALCNITLTTVQQGA